MKWIRLLLVFSFLHISCDSSICEDRKVTFNEFQNRLKIDPGFFEMASETDTLGFRLFIDFDGFTTRPRTFGFCKPPEYENYWTNFDNGSSLYMSLDDFLMRFIIIFNEDRLVYFEVREVEGEYVFFDQFSDVALDNRTLEILPEFRFSGIEYKEVVRIQVREENELLEELIYHRESGILVYKNVTEGYSYEQI